MAVWPDLEGDYFRAHLRPALSLTQIGTTGVEFPLAEIAALAKSYDLCLVVDAVSSLGPTALRWIAWG
jgi:aspartate aminotransferase-like enzyme